ncbi:hypothetical protein [Massilia sp. Bi118]|uniref:pilus assembly PilX family protein n=1 Tax=Massilia sp. Bi118 TaxID=2822346 RepID=UPI001E37E264|nr:hypothetical protein [Massilia sp. Bi118]
MMNKAPKPPLSRILRRAREQGVALPVMLIILAVMLVGSVYLLKSSHSTALATGNLAYDATLNRAADLGLHQGFQWLSTTAAANKAALDADDPDDGYHASLSTKVTPHDDGFWDDAKTITDADGNSIQYVVHRLCARDGRYDVKDNRCVQTSSVRGSLGNAVALGESLASDAPSFDGAPQLHYVIASRINGPRGSNVINQMIVLIGV